MDLSPQLRNEIWEWLIPQLEQHYANPKNVAVAPPLQQSEIRDFVRLPTDTESLSPKEALLHVLTGLNKYLVHTSHPAYFGLFNPRASFAGILADVLTALYNPQMAAWSHAPFAAEVEQFMIEQIGQKMGFEAHSIDGNFTSGGQEANLTAVLCALTYHFPKIGYAGIRQLDKQPVVYCSEESHHSVMRAAMVTGIGLDYVRKIATNSASQISISALEEQIIADIANGFYPCMLVACMGATGTGAIDPIDGLADIAQKYKLWLHADGAYGGALALSATHKKYIKGIERADSITFDAHKWLSVPMGAGMFITKHTSILSATFRIFADYMPKETMAEEIIDPFAHSIQWSRRFIGLKVYLSWLFYGWKGWEELVDEQMRKGDFLKEKLKEKGWVLKNHSPLPIACFMPVEEVADSYPHETVQKVIREGKAWISVYSVQKKPTIRACITNYLTEEADIQDLVNTLEAVR